MNDEPGRSRSRLVATAAISVTVFIRAGMIGQAEIAMQGVRF